MNNSHMRQACRGCADQLIVQHHRSLPEELVTRGPADWAARYPPVPLQGDAGKAVSDGGGFGAFPPPYGDTGFYL